ncbi:MFS transporter [Microbacterium sp. LMC-P-041]|uniref:MFS transporter n=1 Tax=Microbacterium sp. LMC-P-041 TaxID=3040293 RepID=UPI002555A682|nr:MFS transporter [Microbacterium sp. LMC-P-041]
MSTESAVPPATLAPESRSNSGPLGPREPRGYAATFTLAYIGLFFAILTPILGGLSVKLQSLVGLEDAPLQLGLVTGIGALFALVAQPIAGRLSDATISRWGMRRPWIVIGVVGTFVSLVGVGLAPNVVVLTIAWCAAQTFTNFAQAAEAASLADQVPVRRRGYISGLAGAAVPIAILAGAASLNFLPNDFWRAAAPAAVGLIFGLLFALTLKDKVLNKRPDAPMTFFNFISTFLFNPRRMPDLGWAWLTKAMIMLGYGAVGTYLTLFLATSYDMDIPEQLQFNLTATFVSVAFMIAVSIIGGKLSDVAGRRRVFVSIGGVLAGAGILLLAVSPSFGAGGLTVILVAEALIGAGMGLFFAVDAALCVDVLPADGNTAKYLGILNIANTLPAMIAPLIAGVIFIPLGQMLFGAGYTLWFVVAGVVAIAGGVLVFRVRGVR